MPFIVQRYSNSTLSYSGSQYQSLNGGTKKLQFKSGTSTFNYPLTTNTSASQYCKFKIKVGNSTAFLAQSISTSTSSSSSSSISSFYIQDDNYRGGLTSTTNTYCPEVYKTFTLNSTIGFLLTSDTLYTTSNSTRSVSTIAYNNSTYYVQIGPNYMLATTSTSSRITHSYSNPLNSTTFGVTHTKNYNNTFKLPQTRTSNLEPYGSVASSVVGSVSFSLQYRHYRDVQKTSRFESSLFKSYYSMISNYVYDNWLFPTTYTYNNAGQNSYSRFHLHLVGNTLLLNDITTLKNTTYNSTQTYAGWQYQTDSWTGQIRNAAQSANQIRTYNGTNTFSFLSSRSFIYDITMLRPYVRSQASFLSDSVHSTAMSAYQTYTIYTAKLTRRSASVTISEEISYDPNFHTGQYTTLGRLYDDMSLTVKIPSANTIYFSTFPVTSISATKTAYSWTNANILSYNQYVKRTLSGITRTDSSSTTNSSSSHNINI